MSGRGNPLSPDASEVIENISDTIIPYKKDGELKDSPMRYDDIVDEVISSSPIRSEIITPTGSVAFEDNTILSTNSDNLEFKDCVRADQHEIISGTYDDLGSHAPYQSVKGPIQQYDIQLLDDNQSGDFETTFPTLNDVHWKQVIIKPKASGIGVFTIRDCDCGGCILNTETTIEITPAQVNTEVTINLKNRIKLFTGQIVWVKYNGVDLAGHNYVSDPIWGTQFVPYARTMSQPFVNKDIALVEDLASMGDMNKSVYDPTNIEGDVFDMDNMVESAVNKILTDTERTKLTGIQAGAQVNQTDAQIKTQYENNANTNAFTDAEKSKVAGLESSKFLGEFISLVALETAHPSPAIGSYANVDGGVGQDVERWVWDDNDSKYVLQLGESTVLTDAQIKTQYENNPDTNAYTDSEKSKLLGIESNAEVNNISDIDANDLTDNGESSLHYHASDRNRSNHTGNQLASTISDFDTEVANNPDVTANTAKNSYPSADQSKLAGIEAGAEVNQTDAEIKTQYENNANTNAFTDAEKTKVAGLESSKFLGEYISLSALETAHPSPAIGSYANVDQGVGQDVVRYVWDNDDSQYVLQLGESTILTDAQIKTQYENNPDTNAFTDAEKTNLSNQSGSNSGDVTLDSGSTTQESLDLTGQELKGNLVSQSSDGLMSKQDKLELDNISANCGGDGWISGLDVVEDSPKGTSVLYGAGTYLINGIEKSIATGGTYDLANGYGSVNHYSGMTDDQHALVTIYADVNEVIKSIRGDVGEKGDTIFPALQPGDSVCVAYVEIKAGSGGTPKEIDNKHIFDCRTSPSINTDKTVSVSVDDTTTGYLIDKLSNNGSVTFSIENPGGVEKIKANAPVGGSSVPPSITYTGIVAIDGLDVSSLYPEGIVWVNSTVEVEVRSLSNGLANQRIQFMNMTLKKLRFKNDTGVADTVLTEGAADVIADKYGGRTLIFNDTVSKWYSKGIN